MRIRSIRLRNGYKRFRDLTIDLGPSPSKVVALVGPNGSGKSSVFDGMLYLQAGHSQVGAESGGDWKYHSMDADATFDSSRNENVKISFDLGAFSAVLAKRHTAGTATTIFSFRSPYRYSSNLNVTNLEQLPALKNNRVGAGATYHIDQRITDNYQRLYTYIDRFFKKEGSTLTYSQVKAETIGILNKSLSSVLDLTLHDHGDILDGRGTLFFKKADQDKEFAFNVLSSGEKEVIDIIMDLFLRKEHFTETIYIIDEPELHINSAIQRKLLNEIISMIPEDCQLWIATHSIGFLNAIKQDHLNHSSIIWFKGNFANETRTLKPMEWNRRNWKMVFQTALEDLTGLLAPKVIVYCEGRKEPSTTGEEQGLDAQIYNSIFEAEYPDILFVSSGGSTEPCRYSEIALRVLGKAFDEVQILILRDRDIQGDGSPTTTGMRDEWLRNSPRANRMLLRKEIENYLFDFEILRRMAPNIDETVYKTIITDVVDQDLKSYCAQIKRLCGREQLGRDAFKLELAKFITSDTAVYQELKASIF